MFRARLTLLSVISVPVLFAQTPPCGRAIVNTEGTKVEDRFLPAPPAHVKTCLLMALPALAAKAHKEGDLSVEAKTDSDLWRSLYIQRKEAGVRGFSKGMGAMGTFKIGLTPRTENGVAGTQVHIEFDKNAFKGHVGSEAQAKPLMDEAACLIKLLSPSDPVQNPRGPEVKAATAEQRAIVLPEGTPLKIVLREFLYSKDIKKKKDQPIPFEVADDVVVDGTTVIRKGALGIGKFIDAKGARGYGRSAELEFVAEKVTAVDGQPVKVAGAVEKSRGARPESTAKKLGFPTALGMDTGTETIIRAGTSYDVETEGQHTIQAGK